MLTDMVTTRGRHGVGHACRGIPWKYLTMRGLNSVFSMGETYFDYHVGKAIAYFLV